MGNVVHVCPLLPQRRWAQTVEAHCMVSAAMTPDPRAFGSDSGRPSLLLCQVRPLSYALVTACASFQIAHRSSYL